MLRRMSKGVCRIGRTVLLTDKLWWLRWPPSYVVGRIREVLDNLVLTLILRYLGPVCDEGWTDKRIGNLSRGINWAFLLSLSHWTTELKPPPLHPPYLAGGKAKHGVFSCSADIAAGHAMIETSTSLPTTANASRQQTGLSPTQPGTESSVEILLVQCFCTCLYTYVPCFLLPPIRRRRRRQYSRSVLLSFLAFAFAFGLFKGLLFWGEEWAGIPPVSSIRLCGISEYLRFTSNGNVNGMDGNEMGTRRGMD